MNKAVKGALLSGLIFPGLGQLWQKHYLRGCLLIVGVLASLSLIVMKVVQQAYAILEKAEAEGAVDMVAILNAASRASATPDDAKTTAALSVLLFCWVVGIVDAYVAGRKPARGETSHRETDRTSHTEGGENSR